MLILNFRYSHKTHTVTNPEEQVSTLEVAAPNSGVTVTLHKHGHTLPKWKSRHIESLLV